MNLAQAWNARAPRERRVIAGMAVLVAAVLFLAFAWLPVERARSRLGNDLPRLRASVATLEHQANEVRRLRTMPASSEGGSPDAGALPALTGAQVSSPAANRYRVVATDVEGGALLEWLASASSRRGLVVQSAHLERLPAAGHWRGELALAKP
jgi:general secretion pathway protein M